MAQKVTKLTKLSIKEVLAKITLCKTPDLISLLEKTVSSTELLKLRTFKRSVTCVKCGVKATHFWLERYKKEKHCHLNMYASTKGGEMLMTKDHIIPRSLGGVNELSNMQTMCCWCNNRKGTAIWMT